VAAVSMRQLLEAGVHFGHRTRRWNPKMRPFIFTERSGIHIIDLHQTMMRINEYYEMVRNLVADGGTVLFVGTKRQAQGTLQQEAERCGMPYITNRWLGGTLTNWTTIKQRIDYLNKLERRVASGEFRGLTKKEQLELDREIEKLNRRIGGIKTLDKRPDMIFIIDTRREDLAVDEARKLGVPVLAVVDTNCDPDPIDYVIPGNDDAIRAVKLITGVIANAVEEGKRFREVREAEKVETGHVSDQELAEMEQYLGPSTLAKLQSFDQERDDRDIPTADVTAAEKDAQKAANAALSNAGEQVPSDDEVTQAVAEERPVSPESPVAEERPVAEESPVAEAEEES
jgi:small subunit ribosomal protein S2